MKKITTWIICIGILSEFVIVSGCTQTPPVSRSGIEVGGFIVTNQTTAPIYDIQLKVGNSNNLVQCSFLPAAGKFTSGFPLKSYQGNPVIAVWTSSTGQTFTTQPLYARLPEKVDLDRVYLAVAAFKQGNRVEIYLMPEAQP